MSKSLVLILVLALLLSACNLPRGEQSPTPDFVATQVATLLTGMPQPEAFTPTPPPEEPTQTLSEPQDTPTPEPSPTATTSPDDPRDFLGAPTFIDTLDSGRSFGLENSVYDDDYTFIRVEGGALVLTSRYTTDYRGWRTGGTKLKNAYIESTTRVGECAGSDLYGLVFRSPDFIKGYWFLVTCEGDWSVGYWDGNNYVNLASGSNVDGAIKTGSNQVNRLGVMANGDRYQLYANGRKIAEVSDGTFTDEGSYGMLISARVTPNFTIYTEEFAYWKLD